MLVSPLLTSNFQELPTQYSGVQLLPTPIELAGKLFEPNDGVTLVHTQRLTKADAGTAHIPDSFSSDGLQLLISCQITKRAP